MAQTLERRSTEKPKSATSRWKVVIYNNDYNTFDEVMNVLMKATGCDLQEAYIESWETHQYGKAAVHFSNKEECDEAANIIRKVGIRAEVSKEWDESPIS